MSVEYLTKTMKSIFFLIRDFLFVLENKPSEKFIDISAEYEKESEIIAKLTSNTKDDLKITLDLSEKYFQSILDKSDRIRDKAKSIIGSATFISSVIIITSTSIIADIEIKEFLSINTLKYFLYLMLIQHFYRALRLSITVMRREESYELSSEDIVNTMITKNETFVLKSLISKYIANANLTHEFVRKRANLLILSQTAFIMGITHFIMLMIIHTSIKEPSQKCDKLLSNLITNQTNFINSSNENDKTLLKTIDTFLEEYRKRMELENNCNSNVQKKIPTR